MSTSGGMRGKGWEEGSDCLDGDINAGRSGRERKDYHGNLGDDHRMVSNCGQWVDSTSFSTMVLPGHVGTDESVVQGEARLTILNLDQHQNRRRYPRRRDNTKLDSEKAKTPSLHVI